MTPLFTWQILVDTTRNLPNGVFPVKVGSESSKITLYLNFTGIWYLSPLQSYEGVELFRGICICSVLLKILWWFYTRNSKTNVHSLEGISALLTPFFSNISQIKLTSISIWNQRPFAHISFLQVFAHSLQIKALGPSLKLHLATSVWLVRIWWTWSPWKDFDLSFHIIHNWVSNDPSFCHKGQPNLFTLYWKMFLTLVTDKVDKMVITV